MTFVRESQRINIDEANSVYHIKTKEKKVFEQWLDQLALHRSYRRKILDQETPANQNDATSNNNSNMLSNR